MSKERELQCWLRLQSGEQIPRSQVPRSVRDGEAFGQLLRADLISWQRKGNGQVLFSSEPQLLQQYISKHFPDHKATTLRDGFGNLRRYRNSKAATKASAQVLLLRGPEVIVINDQEVDLKNHTIQFGCMAVIQARLKATKVCLVENLDCFLRAEDVLGTETVFIHPYGRLGKNSLPDLQAETLLHFGDYDFTGLDEFLRLRSLYPHTQLFLPANLVELWSQYSTPLKAGATPSKRVQASTLPEVQQIVQLLASTQRFLEQQALFLPENATP